LPQQKVGTPKKKGLF